MRLFEMDPLNDPRWREFITASRWASIFHTPAWLEALRRTYGYNSVVFTDSSPGEPLRNTVLFSRVSSWITGRRLVSVPFSDHCDPITETPAALPVLLEAVRRVAERGGWRYIEVRPRQRTSIPNEFCKADVFCGHALDLGRSLEDVFAGFHKSCIQRAIRSAQREALVCEVGRTEAFLREFYTLHVLTRRRLRAPVQPFRWFRNLAECVGPQLRIYVARYQQRPVAALFILTHGRTAVYKYGSSDSRYNRIGVTPLLFWRAIQDAHQEGAAEFDLGRSDLDNPGLIAFKDHLGARREDLTYFRHHLRRASAVNGKLAQAAERAYSVLPHLLREAVGTHLYGHFS